MFSEGKKYEEKKQDEQEENVKEARGKRKTRREIEVKTLK
jgi:hypothetical protein